MRPLSFKLPTGQFPDLLVKGQTQLPPAFNRSYEDHFIYLEDCASTLLPAPAQESVLLPTLPI